MSLQVSSVPAQTTNPNSNANCPLANYCPSLWGDHFLSYADGSMEREQHFITRLHSPPFTCGQPGNFTAAYKPPLAPERTLSPIHVFYKILTGVTNAAISSICFVLRRRARLRVLKAVSLRIRDDGARNSGGFGNG
ncbi:probable terpene synthase 2 isoform X2 [Fagus crenata]